MSPRILVTGSSGTIGTRLVETLLKRGDDVVGIDRAENAWNRDVGARTVHCDLRDLGRLNAVGEREENLRGSFDALVHLAANARVYDLVKDPSLARDNVLTTWNTLEFARLRGIPRFLFASSRECYGNIDGERLSEPQAKIESCESAYTASKIAGEAFVHAYRRCYDLRTVILRFSNVYGMYDDSVRVVPLFFRNASAGKPLNVFGKDKYLDFTYIDDAIQGILAALDRFDTVNGETINIATGTGTSIVALAEEVKRLSGSASAIEIGASRTGEVIRYVADITKAKHLLGYAPEFPFQEGIRRAAEWYGARN